MDALSFSVSDAIQVMKSGRIDSFYAVMGDIWNRRLVLVPHGFCRFSVKKTVL